MIEIFLEAPMELQLLLLGGLCAVGVVAYFGIKGTNEAIDFNNSYRQDEKWRKDKR